jgi:hypothetical protein
MGLKYQRATSSWVLLETLCNLVANSPDSTVGVASSTSQPQTIDAQMEKNCCWEEISVPWNSCRLPLLETSDHHTQKKKKKMNWQARRCTLDYCVWAIDYRCFWLSAKLSSSNPNFSKPRTRAAKSDFSSWLTQQLPGRLKSTIPNLQIYLPHKTNSEKLELGIDNPCRIVFFWVSLRTHEFIFHCHIYSLWFERWFEIVKS